MMDLLLIASLYHDDTLNQVTRVHTSREVCPILDHGGSANTMRNKQKQ